MQRALLLDIVVRQRAPVLQLLACKNQPLLVGRDALLVLATQKLLSSCKTSLKATTSHATAELLFFSTSSTTHNLHSPKAR